MQYFTNTLTGLRFYKVAILAKIAKLIIDVLHARIDAQLDATFYIINQFNAHRLYLSPTRVSYDEMVTVETAFERIADCNRKGKMMSLLDTVRFYIALQKLRSTHAQSIDYMLSALNVHKLLRHAFLMDS